MFGSWRIARILGTDLFIHWTFWLLPVWIVFTRDDSNLLPLWAELLLVGCLFACVVLHEFGHALAARKFGIRTRSITLSPLGGMARLERMSHKPWEEFCIAIAGPLVNVAIAILLGVGVAGAMVIDANVTHSLWWQLLGYLLAMNIGLVVFNLLPAFPMDGGRVLRAILANSFGLLQGTRIAVVVGTVVAVLIGSAGAYLLSNPWLVLIAVFVIFAGRQELQMLEAEERRRREELRIVMPMWDSQRGQWVRHELSD